MKQARLYIYLLIIAILSGCIGKGERIGKPDNFIAQGAMEEILYQLYLADGLLNNPRIWNDFNFKDSVQNYMDIIENYGYTKPVFDENLKYYFLRKPKKIEAIYDNVLANLTRDESDILQKRKTNSRMRANLWTGKTSFNMPDDGTDNPVEFSLPLVGSGEYSITARIILYADDQSIDPRTIIWFWKDDGTDEGTRIYWDTIHLEKTSRPLTINPKKELNDSTYTHIQGRFLDHTAQPGHWEKHSQVSGILVAYKEFSVEK